MPTCPLPPIFPPKKCFSTDEPMPKKSPAVTELSSGFLPDVRWGRMALLQPCPAVYTRMSPPTGVQGQRKLMGQPTDAISSQR